MESMDRLTRRDVGGGISVENLPAALERLAAYEDAEARGEFLKKGDTVYWPKLQSEGADFTRVDAILITDVTEFADEISFDGIRLHERWDSVRSPIGRAAVGRCGFCSGDIGKYVFLTRAEAEAALKAQERKADSETCLDCRHFRGGSIPHTGHMYCVCELADEPIPDEDRERPAWCPLDADAQ